MSDARKLGPTRLLRRIVGKKSESNDRGCQDFPVFAAIVFDSAFERNGGGENAEAQAIAEE